LLFNFALENGIRRIHVNKDGFKLNGTHHVLVNAVYVTILGGSTWSAKCDFSRKSLQWKLKSSQEGT